MFRPVPRPIVPLVVRILPLGLACMAPIPSRAAEPAVGVVVSCRGGAEIHRPGVRLSAVDGDVLMPGDTVVVATGADCRGFAPTGERFSLDGPAQLVLSAPRLWRARALYELGLYREACQDLMQSGGQD